MKETPDIPGIVEQVAGKLCLLTGAGASAAAGVPTMTSFIAAAFGQDFLESLSQTCPPYHMGTQNLEQDKQNRNVVLRRLFYTANLGQDDLSFDLETLFAFIHHARIGIGNWVESEDVKRLLWMFHSCANSRALSFPDFRRSYDSYTSQLTKWMEDTESAVKSIRDQMYRRFLVTSSDNGVLARAADVYRVLPDVFREQRPVVFSLNFDSLFEAIDEARRWEYELVHGIKPSRYTKVLEFATFLNHKHTNPLYLFKLHGSVTWMRQASSICDTYPQSPDYRQADDVAIAEPVVSKYAEASPFAEMYRIFEAVLGKSAICVAIGISFRDDKLRELMTHRVADRAFRLIIVAPEEDQYPALTTHIKELAEHRNVTWIKGKFGDEEIGREIVKATTS